MSDPISGIQAHTWKIFLGDPNSGEPMEGLYVGGVDEARERFVALLSKIRDGRLNVIGPSGYVIHYVVRQGGRTVARG